MTIPRGVTVAPLIAALLLISLQQHSVQAQPACPANPSNVVTLPTNYSITAVACGLSSPTAMTFYRDTIWVTERVPAVKQIDNMGNVTTKLTASDLPAGTLVNPLTGIVYDSKRDWFWLVHVQTNSAGVNVGAISRFKPSDPVGTFQTMIKGFPSFGDHPNSQIVFGPDGRAYINGAAPTNSGVVGPDNDWAKITPTLHDVPGVDIELSGKGYQTLVPFPPLDPAGGTKNALFTEPYMAFGGGLVPEGTVVKAPTPHKPQQGIIAGGGTVYSFNPNAANPTAMTSTLRLEAWGFRNPYGIGFDPFNPKLLFVSNNGADVRKTTISKQLVIWGSKPIDNDYDDVFVFQIRGDQDSQGNQDQDSQGNQDQDSQGQGGVERIPFFGHPDYFHDLSSGQPVPVTDPRFCPPTETSLPPNVLPSPCPQFAFSDRFRDKLKVLPAFTEIPDLHASANMFDFSRSKTFGFEGDIFIAETGSLPFGTGATTRTGYKVARIDRKTGAATDFIVHTTNTDSVIFVPSGFCRPIDVHFRGQEMFVVDFGSSNRGVPGKIWKVTHQ